LTFSIEYSTEAVIQRTTEAVRGLIRKDNDDDDKDEDDNSGSQGGE
jgi:hypothetical protein